MSYKEFLGCFKNEDLDNYLTSAVPDALRYDSDDSIEYHQTEEDIFISTIDNDKMEDDVYIPTTNTGNIPFEIKESEDISQTRGMSIGGHVILNFFGTMLTRQKMN